MASSGAAQGGEEHKHSNRLVNEQSPYLLQHAHNPVRGMGCTAHCLPPLSQQRDTQAACAPHMIVFACQKRDAAATTSSEPCRRRRR